jgi:hypothetical protein
MTAPAHERAVSVRHLPTDASMLTRVVFWALQPALLLGVLAT